jgi:hypothetical protein
MEPIMRFVLPVLLAFTLSGTAAFAASEEPTVAAEPDGNGEAAKKMMGNIRAEAEAMHTLAGAIKADVAKGKVKLGAGAEGKWDAGSAMWAEIKTLADAGDKEATYSKIRDLRKLFGETMMTGFTGKAGKDTKAAAEAWWKICAERAEHIVAWGKKAELTPANKASFEAATTKWTEAKAKKDAKDFRGAFTTMLQAVDDLDHVMWDVWNGK